MRPCRNALSRYRHSAKMDSSSRSVEGTVHDKAEAKHVETCQGTREICGHLDGTIVRSSAKDGEINGSPSGINETPGIKGIADPPTTNPPLLLLVGANSLHSFKFLYGFMTQ